MPRKYASGRKAWFICQRCGQRGLYRDSLFDGYFPNLRVHPECWEDKHPQENLPKVSDPVALWRPSPEFGGVAPVLSGEVAGTVASLEWTEGEPFNARFDSYTLYRRIQGTEDFTSVITISIGYDEFGGIVSETLEYDDSGLDPATTYEYQVVAVAGSGGEESLASNIVALTTEALPVSCVNLTDHTITATGAVGSGDQEPLIDIRFGTGAFVPLGKFWIGGGASNVLFPNSLVVDGVTPGADPMGFRAYGLFETNEWWSCVDAPVPADYEIMLTASGDTPSGNATGVWLSMAAERAWGYGTVLAPPARSGVWQISIRNASTLVVLAQCDLTVTQVTS